MKERKGKRRGAIVLAATFIVLLLMNSCSQTGNAVDAQEDEEIVMEPLVIEDYSKYSAIDSADFYKNKYLGEIFIIKQWQTSSPQVNTLSVYGKIPFTVHPDQNIDAMEFSNPSQPTIITGYGQGWGKMVTRGEGADISMVCTTIITAEFRLVGGLYPAPTCLLDMDIVTKYITDQVETTCVYSNGLSMSFPVESWVDMFTDVKLPLEYKIPDDYVVTYAKTENNITYDLSYYLYNFWGSPLSEAEKGLIFGDTPAQFYSTGCENMHIGFDTGFLPEGSEWIGAVPDAWDIMLTPESPGAPVEP